MKIVDVAIIGIGLGLTILGLAMRKEGKKNWLALFVGGMTLIVLGTLAIVFGLSL